jgi:hypothetical protein
VDSRALLTRQLTDIAALGNSITRCSRRTAVWPFFRQLCDLAALHVQARDRLLLPAWQRAGWNEVSSDGLLAHARFKRALAELVVSPPGTPAFAGALTRFMRAVSAQREADEYWLLPGLRGGLELAERRALFNDIEALYETGRPAEHADCPAPNANGVDRGRSMVKEAATVLALIQPPAAPASGH